MTTTTTDSPWSLAHLLDAQLLAGLQALVATDRQTTAALLAHLAEVDARRLYREAATSSTFKYCVERLHYAEGAAYKRVHAARAARAFPVIFDLVATGELHLSAVTLLAPHLTAANHAELLAAARHRCKRDVEQLVAARFPKADVPDRVRALPAPRPAPSPPALPLAPAGAVPPAMAPSLAATTPLAAPAPRPAPPPLPRPAPPAVAPLAADRFRVQFTASRDTRDRLREAQDLLRRELPDGDLDAVIGRALTLLVRELKRTRFAATTRPRTRAADVEGGDQPHLPAAVRREVAARDGYQCTFVDAAGNRCAERARLEFHHCDPRGRGGGHAVEQLTLRCVAHHALATEREYGAAQVARAIAARRAGDGPAPGTATRGPAPGTATRGPAPGTATRGPAPGTATRVPAPGTATRGPADGGAGGFAAVGAAPADGPDLPPPGAPGSAAASPAPPASG